MYVAITRARQRLYLSFSQTRMLHGQTRYSLKSRFIDELPEAALKWLTPRVRQQGSGWSGARGGFADAGWRAGPRASGGRQDADSGRASEQEARAAQRFERGVAFRVGQGVSHARFGEGVIVDIEGRGDDARVQVNFGRQGMRWLALAVAKLQALG